MKVLMVTHYFDSHPGGIEIVARQIFHRLVGPDCHITWAAANVSPHPRASAYGASLPLNTWNGLEQAIGLPFPIPSLISLGRLWSAVGASDVVLLHDCLYLSNIAAFIFARMRCVPVVIVQHIATVPYRSFIVAKLMKMANLIITKPMLRAADQVVFISQITERKFRDFRFVRRPMLVFNGVDAEVFHPLSDHSLKAALRARLDLPIEKPVVLFVGRFVEKKGLLILKKMAERHPEMTWAFAGSGPLSPSHWGLPQVKVYRDLCEGSLADLYRASDVFALPSTGEGFPLVIQEALACGLPIVCGAETATADEALAPFARGVPVIPGEDERCAEEFLAAIHDALNTTSWQEKKGERSRFAESRYSWTQTSRRYHAILSEVVSRANGSPQTRSGALRASSTEKIQAAKPRP